MTYIFYWQGHSLPVRHYADVFGLDLNRLKSFDDSGRQMLGSKGGFYVIDVAGALPRIPRRAVEIAEHRGCTWVTFDDRPARDAYYRKNSQ